MDTIPNMARIGGTNLYTPDACKMEAAISSAQYYSLVENTMNDSANKLFKCYTYSGDLNPSIIIPDTDVGSGYMVNVVRVLLGKVITENTVAPPITSATINSAGSFMINGTTPLFTMTLLPTLTNTLADSYYSKYGNIILGARKLNFTYACIEIHRSNRRPPAAAHDFLQVRVAGCRKSPCYW